LITTILDPAQAPAQELAALYHERWEIETALDELKTHLRGAQIVLRSKTPELVEQEFWGLLMAHYAIRGLMHEAALKADEDPTGSPSCIRCTWSNGTWLALLLFPLGRGKSCIMRFSTRSCKSASSPAETGSISAESSAR